MLKRWDVLSSLIIAENLEIGAEIGVKAGENIAHILSACPDFTFYAIDHWDPKRQYLSWSRSAQTTNERMFDRLCRSYPNQIIKFKGDSLRMSESIPAQFFDLIFIDGDHSFRGCLDDILAWLPKLRSGGFMAGHDYDHPRFPGVKKAVDKCFSEVESHDDFVWWIKKP